MSCQCFSAKYSPIMGFARPVVSVDALDERIAMLRADPNVLFAEPVEVRPP